MYKILLLGAGGNAGINFVKSLKLSDKNYYVIGCDYDAYNLSTSNADKKYLMSNRDESKKIHEITRIIEDEGINFIHAQPDPEVAFLCRNKEIFGDLIFPHSIEKWKIFSDKNFCQKVWSKSLGLKFNNAPFNDIKDSEDRFEEIRRISGKVWVRAITGAGSKAALPVSTLSQAKSWVNYWIEEKGMHSHDFMVAEYLPGKEYAVQTFWVDGELIHSQARERLVYFFGNIMPSGQSSTPAVAIVASDEDVYDIAYKAIKSLDDKPSGIYCVDLKRDVGGKVFPLEINYGRFFTTSDFFARLGTNTPSTYVNYSITQKIDTKKIESIKDEFLWIRGLDKEPKLILKCELINYHTNIYNF